jgi:hypothetical protein
MVNSQSIERRILLVAAVILQLHGSAYAQISADEAIGLIDDLPVSRLDPALPKTPFLDWMKDLLGPATRVQWEMDDCGTLTGIPLVDQDRDLPVCMEASVVFSEKQTMGIAIFVGTEKTGLTKAPRVANIYIETDGDVRYFKRLSELQAALRPSKPKQ